MLVGYNDKFDVRELSGKSVAIREWLRTECAAPLELWSAQSAHFSGTERILPDAAALDREYMLMPAALRAVRLYKFDNATLFWDAAVYRDGRKFTGTNILPGYSDLTTSDLKVREIFPLEKTNNIQKAFIFVHNPVGTYGHFMLEMLPKITSYIHLSKEIPDLPILLPWWMPDFVKAWLNLLVPNSPKVYLEQYKSTTINEAFYSDMLVDGYAVGSAFFEFIESATIAASENRFEQISDRLFISRKVRRGGRKDFRTWVNEQEIEDALVAEGFATITPETLSVPEQINAFRRAKIVVGELSSALHNCIFCEPKTRIVQINPFNAVQHRLSMSLGHSMVSIIPDSGRTYCWPGIDEDREFSVDVSRVMSAVGR